jgi:hypothetical protein
METVELSKRFIRYWENSDWESFDDLLDENVKLELTWLEIIINGKENIKKVFDENSKDEPNQIFKIDQIIGNSKYTMVTCSSTRKAGIFGSPSWDLIKGREIVGFEFSLLLEWEQYKLVRMHLNDCSVLTSEVVMKEWIEKI